MAIPLVPSRGDGTRPVIIGGGLAGLMTALNLAPEPVILLLRAPLGEGAASAWAQGGVAAALGEDDSAARHAADTLAAGAGLCDPAAVARITAAAASAVAELCRRGVPFDRDGEGRFALGHEAAHSRRRIVHAAGDGSGRAIMAALIAAVRRTPAIAVVAGEARRLILEDGAVAGVLAAHGDAAFVIPTRRVVVATGGIGGLFRHTTNPLGATGQGLALAARAGAALADMEFVQFHPTALDVGRDPMPLVSEAVRGEGAVLIDETGTRFMAGQGRAELEPRDIVARAVWRHLGAGHRVFLDARQALGARFAARFPGIAQACREAGIDPAEMPIPIRPAAHYHMGGIAVDEVGRSSLPGLWACGEAAATGLHGANRLASNSLLEAAVAAPPVAASVAAAPNRAPRRVLWRGPVPPPADAAPIRDLMSAALGVLRHGDGMRAALAALDPIAAGDGPAADPALVGLVIAAAALLREESRGAHCRSDFPLPAAAARRRMLRLDEARRVAREGVFAAAVGA
jgi:L-aspartate oxidase